MLKYANLLTKQVLEEDYKSLKTITKIASKYSMDVSTISKYMNIHNIPYSKYYNGEYSCTNIFRDETEASFYLAGFIAADGNVGKNKKYNTYNLKISLGIKDYNQLEAIKIMLSSDHPIHRYTNKNGDKYCQINIISKEIYDNLQYFNIVPRKTFNYKFPEHLKNHPLIHHFMRGYMDGDGGFNIMYKQKGRTVDQINTYMRGTKHFLTHFVEILETQSNIISEHERIKKYDSTYSFTYCGNGISTKVANFLYKNATIYLQRKYDKIKHLLTPATH